MAEESVNLTQRVEALEQISHARVVERVGQVEQRVSRIESARETEEPHVATRADIARLETLVVETRSDMLRQMGENQSDLEDKINMVNTAGEKRLRHFLMWLVGTAIALAAVIIAAVAFIVSQLPLT